MPWLAITVCNRVRMINGANAPFQEGTNEMHRHGFCKIFAWQESSLTPQSVQLRFLYNEKICD
jgi:hypothetical protein